MIKHFPSGCCNGSWRKTVDVCKIPHHLPVDRLVFTTFHVQDRPNRIESQVRPRRATPSARCSDSHQEQGSNHIDHCCCQKVIGPFDCYSFNQTSNVGPHGNPTATAMAPSGTRTFSSKHETAIPLSEACTLLCFVHGRAATMSLCLGWIECLETVFVSIAVSESGRPPTAYKHRYQ